MKKLTALFLSLALVFALTACSDGAGDATPTPDAGSDATDTPQTETVVLRVGASPAPHAQILEVAKEILAQENIDLQITEFDDYILPNTAVEDGSLDANYFQHITYLNNFNEENGTHLVSVAEIHYEPFAIYAGKTSSLDALPDGAQIGVPNDGTNEARALMLLEAQGLITLKEGVGLAATKDDIAENPHNYEIVELTANLLTSTLQDLDVAVINGNYAIPAGLKVSDALAVEDSNSVGATTYGNVIAVQNGHENDEKIQALVNALKSDEVTQFIEENYEGAVVPLP